jgi:hypothetical protein
MKITVSYPYGYSEPAHSMQDAERRLRESSDTGKIEANPETPGKYREHREAGFNGPGWYYAGTIFISE